MSCGDCNILVQDIQRLQQQWEATRKEIEEKVLELESFKRQHRLSGTISADAIHRPPAQQQHQMLPSDGQFQQYHQDLWQQNQQPQEPYQTNWPQNCNQMTPGFYNQMAPEQPTFMAQGVPGNPQSSRNYEWNYGQMGYGPSTSTTANGQYSGYGGPPNPYPTPYAAPIRPRRPDSVMVISPPTTGPPVAKIYKDGKGKGWIRVSGEITCLLCDPPRKLDSPDGRKARAHVVEFHETPPAPMENNRGSNYKQEPTW